MQRRQTSREASSAFATAPATTPGTDRSLDLRRIRGGAVIGLPLYLVWTAVMIGLRPEHFVIVAVFGFLFWHPRTARFAYLALPFAAVGILYDNVRLLTDLRGPIHVADLYAAELRWFGVPTAAGREVLPLVLENYTHPVLDFVCGVTYLLYLPQTWICATVLFFVDRRRFSLLGWVFLAVNLLGIGTWLLYPAAPPWYVKDYGLGPAVLDAAASAAGAARFDALLDIRFFESFYARSANVFGAMPSLHCAYPTLVFFVVAGLGRRWAIPAALFAGLMAFSAVYLQHHYVWDVVAGIAYAAAAYFVVQTAFAKIFSPNPPPTALEPAVALTELSQETMGTGPGGTAT